MVYMKGKILKKVRKFNIGDTVIQRPNLKIGNNSTHELEGIITSTGNSTLEYPLLVEHSNGITCHYKPTELLLVLNPIIEEDGAYED